MFILHLAGQAVSLHNIVGDPTCKYAMHLWLEQPARFEKQEAVLHEECRRKIIKLGKKVQSNT